MACPAGLNRVFQRPNDVFLSDDFPKCLWPPLSVQRQIGHGMIPFSPAYTLLYLNISSIKTHFLFSAPV
jgi:hypothetical protein